MTSTVKLYLNNGLKLEMAYIPGGSFLRGSSEEEAGDYNEGPQHKVNLKPFLMGTHPVTQAQYRAIMGKNPAHFTGRYCPVEMVSWVDAIVFCYLLSKETGRNFSLPSESQWEYACRAGTTKPFNCGEIITTELANYDGREIYGYGPKGEYRGRTSDVEIFPPNNFGLYDMHGNVWEWCTDEYHENYVGAPTDGSVWLNGDTDTRLLRGGSWCNGPRWCRSAFRGSSFSDVAGNDIGFRIVSVPQGS